MSLPLRPVHTFGILGAGTLGWKIGLRAAMSGYEVLMYDVSAEQLAAAQRFQGQFVERFTRKGVIAEGAAAEVRARLSATTDAAEFAEGVDFVSESVTEDLDLKRRVWGEFAERWRERAVLTTNTSYLLPSQFAEDSGDPARFCAFHFHDVFEARVVDVMPHPGTDEAVVDRLMALGTELAQVPVHVRAETPGYLYNFMLMAYLGAAGQLAVAEKGSVEDIDRSWMGNMQTRIGPFGMMDLIGLDTVDHVLGTRSDRRSAAFRELIAPKLAAGELGVKTGRGFYRYPKPRFADPDFLGGAPPSPRPSDPPASA